MCEEGVLSVLSSSLPSQGPLVHKELFLLLFGVLLLKKHGGSLPIDCLTDSTILGIHEAQWRELGDFDHRPSQARIDHRQGLPLEILMLVIRSCNSGLSRFLGKSSVVKMNKEGESGSACLISLVSLKKPDGLPFRSIKYETVDIH